MADNPLIRNITRAKLAQVFKTPELVKLFEDVLYGVGTTLPDNTNAVGAALTAHINKTPGAHAASAISVTPAGGIAATDAQGALVEIDADLSAHAGDTGNPHLVTKAQVGLGSVDNTSDADKPVSTAQQAALDLKANAASLGTMSTQNADAVAITGGAIYMANGYIGYAPGAGGQVTQITSKATGVTLDKITGQITTHNAALAAGAVVSFTLTNNQAGSTDLIIPNHISGGTIGAYLIQGRCISGAVVIYITNISAGSLSEALIIRYAIFKGAVA